MKKRIIPFLFLLIIVSCGGGDDGSDVEIAVPVSVVEINPGSIEEFVIATGTVNAMKETTYKSEAGGQYVLLTNPATGGLFVLGDRVEKGTEIIRIINEEEENRIRIDSKRLSLETLKLEYENQKSLFEKGGVTRLEFTQTERNYIDAKYDMENAKIALAKLHIRAPFDGMITSLPYYTPGVELEVGNELIKIEEFKELYLEISLPGKDMGRCLPGQDVRIMNYTIPDDTLGGKVMQASPTLDRESRSFKVSIHVDNPKMLLRPGMFVRGEIIVARSDSTIVIPKDIIQVKQRGKTVFIVQKGAAQERLITTGLENPDLIEVIEGLEENDRLVVRGFETLRNRSKVKVVR